MRTHTNLFEIFVILCVDNLRDYTHASCLIRAAIPPFSGEREREIPPGRRSAQPRRGAAAFLQALGRCFFRVRAADPEAAPADPYTLIETPHPHPHPVCVLDFTSHHL